MRALPPYSYDDFNQDANQLFDHWRTVRLRELSTDEVITRFKLLFIEGVDYPEWEILEALRRIVVSEWANPLSNRTETTGFSAPLNFNGILNHCFYILINYWWMHSSDLGATTRLVNLVNTVPADRGETYTIQRLRELVRQFGRTDAYEALQDRVRVATETHEQADQDARQPLRRLVYRYPFLYPHFLTRCDDSESGFDAIRRQQKRQSIRYEENLKNYLNYLVRGTGQSNNHGRAGAGANPTKLSDRDLKYAIKQFMGASQGSRTYEQSAQQAINQIRRAPSCLEMKRQIHGYVTSAFQFPDNPHAVTYSQSHFSPWLEDRLQESLWEENYERPTGHRLIRTCDEIISCLLANPKDPIYRQFHPMFVNLHGHFGATFTTGLLLKVVLLFKSFRDYTERMLRLVAQQFAALLKHYGTANTQDENVKWLVECLENWQLAVSFHFGRTDFSGAAKWSNLL